MTRTEFLARCDKYVRPLFSRYAPPAVTVSLYSKSRPLYMKTLVRDIPEAVALPEELAVDCWGIPFRSAIMNAAGMFKNGEGYQLVAAQGAGAYLAGTTTGPPRAGNTRDAVSLPFAPYPLSGASSNWLGLPNDGDKAVAARLSRIPRQQGCPIGISLMGSPDLEGEEKLETLVSGMQLYARAGVDFIEVNESCPNTEEGAPQENELYSRLQYLSEAFLAKRERSLPVLVKFSLDTEVEQVEDLCKMLLAFGFDGITLGNTSTKYQTHRNAIALQERRLFDYFTSTFGGGLGGVPVKEAALSLVREASRAIKRAETGSEFHIVRTGGVESAQDVVASLEAGASLVQWYTGYFECFAAEGHSLYENMYAAMMRAGS